MHIVFKYSTVFLFMGTVGLFGFIFSSYGAPNEKALPRIELSKDDRTPTLYKAKNIEARTTNNDEVNNDKILSDIFDLPIRSQPEAQSKVIIVTYLRSGSTFTGDILSSHPDIFYLYEPLHSVSDRHHIFFNYLGKRKQVVTKEKTQIYALVTRCLLRCDLEKLDLNTLTQLHLKSSRDTKGYWNCLRKHHGIFGMLRCLKDLYHSCLKASVLLIKTIRLSMETISTSIFDDRTVKIIHLIRDPRATINSEGRYNMYNYLNKKSFEVFTNQFCSKLTTDLKIFYSIKGREKERATVVLYENLAENPVEITGKLLKFMNLNMLPSVVDHIHNITRGKEESCPLCVSRANSVKTSQEWRLYLSYTRAKFIENACAEAFEILGYKRAENEQVFLNTSYPLHTKPPPYLAIY